MHTQSLKQLRYQCPLHPIISTFQIQKATLQGLARGLRAIDKTLQSKQPLRHRHTQLCFYRSMIRFW
jgi:hypothetical protein